LEEKDLTGLLGDLINPPMCPVCGTVSGFDLCDNCKQDLKIFDGGICNRCGRPVFLGFDKTRLSNRICILCKDKGLYFLKARSYSLYSKGMAKLIKKYRSNGYKVIEKIITDMLFEAYKRYYADDRIDLLDTHRPGMYSILDTLSKRLSVPFARNIIKTSRSKNNINRPEQDGEISLEGLYKVKDTLKTWSRKVLLIDYAALSGKTLNSLSFLLKKAGAESISVLTVATAQDRKWL
jgi:predicted amidophosphoribosyltransferase